MKRDYRAIRDADAQDPNKVIQLGKAAKDKVVNFVPVKYVAEKVLGKISDEGEFRLNEKKLDEVWLSLDSHVKDTRHLTKERPLLEQLSELKGGAKKLEICIEAGNVKCREVDE